jgi:hypothetical protein
MVRFGIWSGAACCVLAASALGSSKVWIVDPNGIFTDVQQAVDLAQDGDTILIQAGTYTGFTVDAKSLSIVTRDPTANVTIQGLVTIKNLAATQSVVLEGADFDVAPPGSRALDLVADLGAVRIQGGTYKGACGTGGVDGFAGALVDHCSNVTFSDVTVLGGIACEWPSNGARGMQFLNSNVAIYQATVTGGNGIDDIFTNGASGTNGGDGVFASGGFLFVSGSSFTGGSGADGADGFGDCTIGGIGPGSGGDGGNAIAVSGAAATARVLDCQLTAGDAGVMGGGTPTCGATNGTLGVTELAIGGASIVDVPGPHRTMHSPMPAHELGVLPLQFESAPGDRVYVFLSTGPRFLDQPQFGGVSLLKTPIFYRAFMGVVPASGKLDVNLGISNLPPGVEAVTWYAQEVVLDALGHRQLGGPATLCVLDSSF